MTILVQKPYKMDEVEILQDWANIIVVLKGNSGLSERGRLRPRDFVTLRAAASGIPSVEGGAREGEPRMNIAFTTHSGPLHPERKEGKGDRNRRTPSFEVDSSV